MVYLTVGLTSVNVLHMFMVINCSLWGKSGSEHPEYGMWVRHWTQCEITVRPEPFCGIANAPVLLLYKVGS